MPSTNGTEDEIVVVDQDDLVELTIPSAEITVRSASKREIDVRLAPFNTVIETIDGPETVEPGAFRGIDPKAVWLMGAEHEVHLGVGQDGTVVPTRRRTGRALSIWEDDQAGYATFRVAKTSAGDDILYSIAEGLYDGVSIEMGRKARVRREKRNGRMHRFVEFSDLQAASPTYQPAYAEARVLAVRSQQQEDAPVAEDQAPANGAPNDEAAAVATAPTANIEAAITSAFEKFGTVQARSSSDVLAVQEKMLERLEKIEEANRASFQIPTSPTGVQKPDDFSTGDWMKLVLKYMSGDQVDNSELQARVAADLVTADNLGVIPPMFTGNVRETIDISRPFLESTTRLNLPQVGQQLTVPVIVTRPTVDVQSSEKHELASTATEIEPAYFNPVTIGGYGDISLQLLKMSDPSYLELYLDLLAEAYASKADDEAVDALLSEVSINDGGTLDPEDASFGEAWANAVSISRRFGPNRIWLSSTAVAAFIDAKANGTNMPLYSNLEANFTAGGGAGGTISGLRPVHVPALDDEAVDVIVGPARGFGWGEKGTYTLQVDVPARAGRDVGLVGILWFAPMYPAAFTTYTLPS